MSRVKDFADLLMMRNGPPYGGVSSPSWPPFLTYTMSPVDRWAGISAGEGSGWSRVGMALSFGCVFAAAGCAVGAASLTIAAFSFGLWQEWWICLMAMAFAACVVLGRQLDREVAP